MQQETGTKGVFESLQASLHRLSDHNIAYALAFCTKSTDLLPGVDGKIYADNAFSCLTATEAVALVAEMEIVKNRLIEHYGLSKAQVMKHAKNIARDEVGIYRHKINETTT